MRLVLASTPQLISRLKPLVTRVAHAIAMNWFLQWHLFGESQSFLALLQETFAPLSFDSCSFDDHVTDDEVAISDPVD